MVQWVLLYEMGAATGVQIMDEAICISRIANALGSDIHPTVLPQAMDE